MASAVNEEIRETDAADPETPTKRKVIRCLLLPREGTGPILYYEPRKEPEEDEAPPSTGLRGAFHRLRRGIQRLDERTPRWLRSTVRWVRNRLPVDERLLMALRTADEVVLHHPSAMTGDEAEAAWRPYLDSRLHRRVASLIIYAVLLVPTTLMFVLPGPNVVGIWVAYRLFAHAVAVSGLLRARRGKVEVATEASEALDGPIIMSRAAADRAARHFDMPGLRGRLKRARVLERLKRRQAKRDAA